MNGQASATVFSALWLPRPLDPNVVLAFLARLAADPASPAIVFEACATTGGIAHSIGVPANHVQWVARALRDHIPGTDLRNAVVRPVIDSAVEVQVRPPQLGLIADDPTRITTALLSSLRAHLAKGESLCLQIVLGDRTGGRVLRGAATDPAQPWWSIVTLGSHDAPTAVQHQIATHLADNRFRTAIRIGATAHTKEKRRRLVRGVFGALGTARTPGVHLVLTRDRPARLISAQLPRRWPMTLTPAECVGLLAWPIGDGDLPGLPPLHPRMLLPTRIPSPAGRAFGTTSLPGTDIEVGVNAADALMHQILLGPTGVGKSTVLLNQIAADARAGRPLLVLDPKKQLIDDIVNRCIPTERADDVVIMDCADPAAPGLNPLDVGDRDPDVVVDGLLAVFKAVFQDGWGPRTEDIFLACLLTLARAGQKCAIPFTLLDLPRLLTEDRFRTQVIGSIAGDPTIDGFWATYNQLSFAAQAAMIAAPMNKLRRYLLRPAVRGMLGQASPTFRLRDLFRDNKIVLVPLNEGLIGPITAQLLGSLIVAEAWSATMERANEQSPATRPAFVVVDECQNFVHLPTSFSDALSQSRSYGVGWVLAHQARQQLTTDLVEAIDTNARNKVFFRLESTKDATAAAKLSTGLAAEDFQQLPAHTAYARVVTDGESSGWCTVATFPPPAETGAGPAIRRTSRDLYGRQQLPDSEIALRPAETAADQPLIVGRKRRGNATGDAGG